MGFQRLLLAGVLLFAARACMVLAASPPAWLNADGAHSAGWEANPFPPQSPLPVLPNPQSSDLARDDRYPVQSWNPPSQSGNSCQTAGSAVVTVYAGREIGSGSIVSADGLVITNFHVVDRLRNGALFVRTLGGDRYAGQVLATDQRHDLALLRVMADTSLPTVQFAAPNTATIGERVCAIGSPLGEPGVLTQGQVIGVMPNGDLKSNVVLKPGNSGGPLLNQRGEMIGVNKGVARMEDENGDRASFATSAAIAQDLVAQNRVFSSAQPNALPQGYNPPPAYNSPPADYPPPAYNPLPADYPPLRSPQR